MAYGIGLDIGITSVGYAVLALDWEENPWGIIRLGSRIFDAAEQSGTGASLALPRRQARGTRRRLRRHRHRIERIKNLILRNRIITTEQLNHLNDGHIKDIYALRVKALDERVGNLELARILLHIAKRRGFKSNRKSETDRKEAGALKQAISENQKVMETNGYRTVGEMFFKDPRFESCKRNKGGNYTNTVERGQIAQEAESILKKQVELGNTVISEVFIQDYLSILLSQRAFDEGPGGNSPYGGNQIEKMIGTCTFEDGKNGNPAELRAAKACYSFEYFNLLQKVNHIRMVSSEKTRLLTDEERKIIIDLVKSSPSVDYEKIRSKLQLGSEWFFKGLPYKTKDKVSEIEKKEKFNYLPFYHQIRKELNKVSKNRISEYNVETLDEIGRILTCYKGDDKCTEEMIKAGIPTDDIDVLLNISGARKFCHLSLKALRKLIPFLEQGMTYDKACVEAGYDFKGHTQNLSYLLPANGPELENITNPVVRRAIAQSIKVINAIIREQGESPLYINVELAREMAKDRKERDAITKQQTENKRKNDSIMQDIKDDFHKLNPSGMDLIKLKLWREQDGRSTYSQEKIEYRRLFDIGYVEVDHIIPYSISFDDSYNNKVLVFSHENQDKGNHLPYQYILQKYGQEAAERYKVWVSNDVKNFRKRQRLLKERLTSEDLNGFKERNLQDTKYISKFMYNYIRDHLQFAPSETGKKKRVAAVNGMITSYLRKRWGIRKIRENGDIHHAVDAVVIGCTTDHMIQELSRYSEDQETEYDVTASESRLVNKETGEILKRFPLPWEGFRQELEARCSEHPERGLSGLSFYMNKELDSIKPIFVSRMPKHKVTGAVHEDTIRSPRHLHEGFTISKVKLTKLKLNKDNEIADYYNPESDRILYSALKDRLIRYKGKAEEAFKEPFYKPKADGTLGPLVKKVKLVKKSTIGVSLHNGTGIASNTNGSMVRVDVFKVENDGYYLVPIYVADTVKKELPNKAIVAYKPYDEWPVMDEKNFIFSLYPNDLIYVESKNPITLRVNLKNSDLEPEIKENKCLFYYQTTNINTGAIKVITHDNSYWKASLGARTLKCIEKYQVDVLGNYHRVQKEVRKQFK